MDTVFQDLLPWAQSQRWFPTDWREAPWPEVEVLPLGRDTAILLARPYSEAALLQLPLRRTPEGFVEASGDMQFWTDWLEAAGADTSLVDAQLMGKEQSNTSVILTVHGGSRWVAKLFRVVHPGVNPDMELPLALRKAGYKNTPAVHAWLSADVPEGSDGLSYTLGVATELVENTGTAWDFFRAAGEENRDVTREARELGVRIGELTAALNTLPANERPSIEALADRVQVALDAAAKTAGFGPDLTGRIRWLIQHLAGRAKATGAARVHGDLHLGQILHTPDGDWQVIDFEGEPLRSLSERVLPDFASRDLAGMLRSFSYAGWDNPAWATRTRAAFLEGFAEANPLTDPDLLHLLEVEKALYEVQYEAQFRPDWIKIPLASIESLLDSAESGTEVANVN